VNSVPPLLVVRYGIYVAFAIAAVSAWLSYRAGFSVDVSLLRAVVAFVLFTVLAFAAEAVLTLRAPEHEPREPTAGGEEEGEEAEAAGDGTDE